MSVVVTADIYCPIFEMSQKQHSASALKIDISSVYCAAAATGSAAVDGAYPWFMLYATAPLGVPRQFAFPCTLLSINQVSSTDLSMSHYVSPTVLLGVHLPEHSPAPPAQTHPGQLFVSVQGTDNDDQWR